MDQRYRLSRFYKNDYTVEGLFVEFSRRFREAKIEEKKTSRNWLIRQIRIKRKINFINEENNWYMMKDMGVFIIYYGLLPNM